jgi:hypothetical protein
MSAQVIGTWLIIFIAALIGGASISTLSNIVKKRILSSFLILITLAFFVFILNTDANPYFNKTNVPFTGIPFGTDSIHKAREFIEVLPKDKNVTGDNLILSFIIYKYLFLKNENRNGKPLYIIKLNETYGIIFIFSKYGLDWNAAYYDKPIINNFIYKIKEKEANILLNSDNVIILQK